MKITRHFEIGEVIVISSIIQKNKSNSNYLSSKESIKLIVMVMDLLIQKIKKILIQRIPTINLLHSQVLTEAKLWLDATNIDGYNNSSLNNGSEINNWIDLR